MKTLVGPIVFIVFVLVGIGIITTFVTEAANAPSLEQVSYEAGRGAAVELSLTLGGCEALSHQMYAARRYAYHWDHWLTGCKEGVLKP